MKRLRRRYHLAGRKKNPAGHLKKEGGAFEAMIAREKRGRAPFSLWWKRKVRFLEPSIKEEGLYRCRKKNREGGGSAA